MKPPRTYAEMGPTIITRNTVTGELLVADDKYELGAKLHAAGWATADTEDLSEDQCLQAQLGKLFDTNELAYVALVEEPFLQDRLTRLLGEPTQETRIVGPTDPRCILLPDRTPVTTAEVDRLLGLADEHLDDWRLRNKQAGDELSDEDAEEYTERVAEWQAVRPLLVAAPELLATLNALLDWGRDHTSLTDPNSPHDLLVRAHNLISTLTK